MDLIDKHRTFLFLDELDSGDRNPPTHCRKSRQAEPISPLISIDGEGPIILDYDWIGLDGGDIDEGQGEDPVGRVSIQNIGRSPQLVIWEGEPGYTQNFEALTFPDFKQKSMITWEGQNYEAFSTFWEALHSPLHNRQNGLKPVVDDCGLLIGYFHQGVNTNLLHSTGEGEIFYSNQYGSHLLGAQSIGGHDLWLTAEGQVRAWSHSNVTLGPEHYAQMYHERIPAGNKADILTDIDGYVMAIHMYLDPPPEKELGFWDSPVGMFLGFILPSPPSQECLPGGSMADTYECELERTLFMVDFMFLFIDIMSLGTSAIARKAAIKVLRVGMAARRAARSMKGASQAFIKSAQATAKAGRLFLQAPKLARAAPKAVSWTKRAKFGKFFSESGMLEKHFHAAQEAVDAMAKEGKEVYVLFRPTNVKSVKWIEKGFPPKGLNLKVKTSKTTGIVTAAQKQYDEVWKEGFYVINDIGGDHAIAAKMVGGKIEKFKIAKSDWPFEIGQVIDPKSKKPFVGDYDLLGVIDAKATGRNLTDVSKGVKDFSDPLVTNFRKRFNGKLDQPRSLHGPQEKLLHDEYGGLLDEGAVLFRPGQQAAFLPDGAAVNQFYSEIGRPTIMGSHARPGKPFIVTPVKPK
jgi:hypothetical protein